MQARNGNTLEKRAEGLAPSGLFSLRTLGFALIRAWVYLMFLDATSTFIAGGNAAWLVQTYIYSTVALSATLFVCAFAGTRTLAVITRGETRLFAPAAACLGTLFIALSGLPDAPAAALCVCGGVATGVGSGLIDLGYGELYRTTDTRRTNFEVPFAFFLAAVLFCATVPLPALASSLVCSALPLASAAILLGQLPRQETHAPATAASIEIAPFAWRIGLCACLVGIGDGVVRAVCLDATGLTAAEFYQFPLVVGAVLTMAIIFVCVLITPPEQGGGLRKVYRSAAFVMAVFYMLLPLTQGVSYLECTLALTGYGTFNVLIWLLLAETSRRYQLESPTVFGIGWGMVTLGVLLGALAGRWVVQAGISMSAVAFFATVCILASYLFVLKESDFASIVTPAELVAFAAQAEGPAPLAETGPAAIWTPSLAGSEAATDARPAGAESAEEADEDEPRRARFMEGCEAVARRYGLTPKETEIMVLYAKGRTSTHIQQELYLSRGTVTTHLRHIYQKIDIHSKQELLDAIEAERAE